MQLDELLPVKAAVTMTKLSNRTSVYSLAGSGNPLFFELDHGGLYPTVYTLWRYPSLVPVQIATYSEVTPKVRAAQSTSCNGPRSLRGIFSPKSPGPGGLL